MLDLYFRRCFTRLSLVVLYALMGSQTTIAAPVSSASGLKPTSSPLLELAVPLTVTENPATLGAASGQLALGAISRGRWSQACSIAAAVLAHQVADADALGVFALCAAIRNDSAATHSALNRLREAEPMPYYSSMVQGLQSLGSGEPEQAHVTLKSLLRSRAGDSLALYFSGETLHALGQDGPAITAFRAVLANWPEHTPALTAIARLLSGPQASKKDLQEALGLTERATSLDPTNRAHWQLLASLCERTGQQGRANAITLQWLGGPPKIK